MKRKLKWLPVVLAAAFGLLQFANPARTNPPVKHDWTADVAPPPKIAAMFRAACYDCHSDETQWPWYSRVAPVSWLVADDVNGGRKHLNFSDWPSDQSGRAARNLENMSEKLDYKEMPPAKYTLMHPEADLTDSQRKELTDWLNQEAARLKSPAASKK